MALKNAGNLVKGDYILFRDVPHVVLKHEFMNPGKGSAIMRTKLRNVKTGGVLDFTFKANENVELLNIDKKEMQYLYHDSQEVVFMDPRSYEQVSVPVKLIEEKLAFLVADMLCWVSRYEDEAIDVILPVQVKLKVVESEPASGGNTVNAAKKLVKLETGLEVMVPLFVKENDYVLVDTSNGQYVSRAS